jgi:hypothetical protein
MSTISNALQGILFNGSDLDLASADWKAKVSAIYGFNASGNGYTVFKPASTFNSLTKLVQDGSYIVAASTPGFELPGAVSTATTMGSVSNGLITINTLTVKKHPVTGNATVVANVVGADVIRVFYKGPAEFIVSEDLLNGRDTVVETDKAGIAYDDLDSGRLDIQLMKGGVPVLNYSFWIHD